MKTSTTELVQARPWETPWWKPSKNNYTTFAYLLTIHILTTLGLILYTLPSWPVAMFSFILAILGGLGVSVCYHRALSHRAVKLHWLVEQILIFLAIFNGNSSPLSWVANHRQHHAKADTVEDISSPRYGGFWWAHLRWVYQWPGSDPKDWSPDLGKKRYTLWDNLIIPTMVMALCFGLIWGWEGFFWIGAIRMCYSLHLQMVVNSLLHMSPQALPGTDSSRNIWWLGPLQLGAWGENWHHNHHSEANSAKFSRHWSQIDVGWYFIRLLQTLHLAKDVRLPKAERIKQAH